MLMDPEMVDVSQGEFIHFTHLAEKTKQTPRHTFPHVVFLVTAL
jgi:hypothetical protein